MATAPDHLSGTTSEGQPTGNGLALAATAGNSQQPPEYSRSTPLEAPVNTDDPKPFFDDPGAVLREIAKNSAAYATYFSDFQLVLLDMQSKLEILQRETRVHCRETHVEGDKWGQARLRSFPVEKSLNDAIKDIKSLISAMEKSTHRRRAHDEKVKAVGKQRKEKAQLKAQENSPQLQAAPENRPEQGAQAPDMGYGGPTSIYDLGRRESA